MSPEDVRQLFDYNSWANARVRKSAGALTPEQFTKNLGSSFSSVRDTLAHIWGAESIWIERLHGRTPTGLPEASQFPDLPSLESRWLQDDQRLKDYVASLTQEKLNEVHEYRTFKSGICRNPVWQALQHLANHGTYHRGQVATLLRQLQADPAFTDLIYFYREQATAKVA